MSSWIAAGISFASLAGGVVGRAWWNRSTVDWEFAGEVTPAQGGLRFSGTVSNFGDGPAHRVVVYVHRPGSDAERIGFVAFIEPGSAVEWSTVLTVDDLDGDATLSVGWTPPPIRRRSESSRRGGRWSPRHVGRLTPRSCGPRWETDGAMSPSTVPGIARRGCPTRSGTRTDDG